MEQEITREIEIDAGHRIPNHESKCKNFHGHRYKIQATVRGEICVVANDSGEGMVVDFGFLKDIMMQYIHDTHDHGMMLWSKDASLPKNLTYSELLLATPTMSSFIMQDEIMGKLIIMSFIPTAENLAYYFHQLLYSKVINKGLELTRVRVYETPNCWADYSKGN